MRAIFCSIFFFFSSSFCSSLTLASITLLSLSSFFLQHNILLKRDPHRPRVRIDLRHKPFQLILPPLLVLLHFLHSFLLLFQLLFKCFQFVTLLCLGGKQEHMYRIQRLMHSYHPIQRGGTQGWATLPALDESEHYCHWFYGMISEEVYHIVVRPQQKYKITLYICTRSCP